MNQLEEVAFKNKIVEKVKLIAQENNLDSVSISVFKKYSGYSSNQIFRRFDGGMDEINTLAGLKPDTSKVKKTVDELFEELLRVSTSLQHIPGRTEFNRKAKFSDSPYVKRFHTWPGVLVNFKDWLKIQHPTSGLIDLLQDKMVVKRTIPATTNVDLSKAFEWPSIKDVSFGAPMNFRGLINEPINEDGVIFLFGKISEEMSFNIEAVRAGFPDCEGKRLVDRNKNLWQKVSIEFEFMASNFKEHGHDPKDCDLVVCWINDWPDCPIEVIELKSVVNKLMKKDS